MTDIFELDEYTIRRKVFTLFSPQFHVYAPDGELVGYCKQKAFRLKEDIRLYSDESMEEEIILIKARNIVDFSAAYDVIDSERGKKVGALRRKGFASIIRDSWEFLDRYDEPYGKVEEDSMGLALVRRFIANIIPQSFKASIDGEPVANFKQHFNPFIFRLTVTLEPNAEDEVDPALILAAGILLTAIEGRQR